MAQLHHILGSILRDIAQARVTSDIYSREVSQFYEQDSLLRLFPIPRTEIKEIEIDLKFAISEIAIDPDRREDTEGKLAGIFEHYSELISNSFFEKLKTSNKTDLSFQEAATLVDTPENKSALRAAVLDYFLVNKRTFLVIEESEENLVNMKLNQDLITTRVNALFASLMYSQLKDISFGSAKSTITKDLKLKLENMNAEVEYLETSEYKANVIVSNQDLQLLPEGSISNIKIVTTLKNYVWSQVEEKDGKVIRRLIPE